jgi:hypothetical protein
MTPFGNWFGNVRQVLEVLYYLSGIAIAVAAFWGLKQLSISKKIARENATREAYKLAADNCRYFAKEVVPLQTLVVKLIKERSLQSFASPHFVAEQAEIKGQNFDLTLLQREFLSVGDEIIAFLNPMEAFAIFFASGVAAEEIGYRKTGTSFCGAVERYMPAIFLARLANVRYESIVKLYEIRHGRQLGEKISTQMKALEDAASRLPKETIKPIGT